MTPTNAKSIVLFLNCAHNNGVHRRTRAVGFEVEHPFRVPGDAQRYAAIQFVMNNTQLITLCTTLLILGCADPDDSPSTLNSTQGTRPEDGVRTELIDHGVPTMLQFYENSGTIEFTPECRAAFETLLQKHGWSDLDEIERFGNQLRSEVVRMGLASEEEAYLLPNDYESHVLFRANGFRPD